MPMSRPFILVKALVLALAILAGVLRPSMGSDKVDKSTEEIESSTYFFVKDETPRCFVVTSAQGSKFHVHYLFPDYGGGREILLEDRQLREESTIKDRFSPKLLNSYTIEDEKGSFTFQTPRSHTFHHHSICASTKSPSDASRGLRLHLRFDTGEANETFEKRRKDFHLEDDASDMNQLAAEARRMVREADYMQREEIKYHKDVLRFNREVVWWPIFQVVLILVIGYYQVRHLKDFFKTKRLV